MTLFESIITLVLEHKFLSILAVLISFVMVFGKRIEKRFDLEAEFRDDQNREIAEFDTKSWREMKSEDRYQFEAKFKWRDPSLVPADAVEVFLGDDLVLKGTVSETGRIFLGREEIQKELTEAKPGMICRVLRNDIEVMSQPVVLD